jgi:LuxR family transcriptional regulator, maltose regulon positive regulatory protein
MGHPSSAERLHRRPSRRLLWRKVLGVTEPGVEREALLRQCSAVRQGGLFVLEAPAGFGKTYVLAQWCDRARRTRHSVAWVGLRPAEKSPATIATRLVETLRSCGVKSLTSDLALRIPSGDQDFHEFVGAFIHSVGNHGRRILLVLDDYQTIEGGAADVLLSQIFEQLPANLVVALASRRACPIGLSRVLLQGRLHRIGPRSLLFSKAEARDFFDRALGAWQLSSLYALTEGWPAALKMAQLCLPEWRRKSGDIDSVPEFARLIGQYCDSEVLRYANSESIDLLTECSIVKSLAPDLCNAIRRRTDSAQILADLATHETFLDATDVAANSWRLPRLLRQTLARRAAKRGYESTATANLRAAEYFEREGQTRDALQHYVDSHNPALAAVALERAAPLDIIHTHGDVRGQELLDIIPYTLLRGFPRLALLRAYLDNKRGLLDEARALLAEVALRTAGFTQDRPGGNDLKLKTDSLCLELLIDIYRRSRAPIQYLHTVEEQMARVSTSDVRLMIFFRITLGILYRLRGDLEIAETHFIQCQKLNVADRASWVTLWLKYHSGSIALARGQLMDARYHLHAGLKLWHGEFRSYPTYRALANIALAEIAYETDSLDEAQVKLGEEIYTAEHIDGSLESYATLYEISMMMHWHAGRPDQVESLLARGVAIKRVGVLLERYLPALRLHFELLQGRLEAARSIIDTHRFRDQWAATTYQDEFTYREWDLIGICLCHLAIHERALRLATEIVDRLKQVASLAGRRRTVVKALILRAVIAFREADERHAIDCMLHALELAEPLGYRRVFLDEKDFVRPILEAIKSSDSEIVPARLASYAKTLCSALLKKDKAVTTERGVRLSERELDVLRELSAGHSNKLIARNLGLAAPTVKFHVKNIFRKLAVRKRAAAVAEAHRRGWLS